MRLTALFLSFAAFALAQTPAPAPAPPPVPATVIADRDVAYPNVGGRQTMDIIRPKDPSATPRPAVLLIHGAFLKGSPPFRGRTNCTLAPTRWMET